MRLKIIKFRLRQKDKEELTRKICGWNEMDEHFRQTNSIREVCVATKRLRLDYRTWRKM